MRFLSETSGVVISGINQRVHDPTSKRARKGKFAYFALNAVTSFLHRKIYMKYITRVCARMFQLNTWEKYFSGIRLEKR